MKKTVFQTITRAVMLPFLIVVATVEFAIASATADYNILGAAPNPIHTPSATVAQQSERYLSLLDIQKPSIRNMLIRRFNDQGLGLLDVISSLGYKEAVTATEYSHFEEDWIEETITESVGAAAPGQGNPITITLSASNVDSSGKFYVRLWDDILFPNQVTGKVYDIDTSGPLPVLTVYPHQQGDDIGAIAAGQELSIYSNGFLEGSDTPSGRLAKVSKLTYNVKILMEAFEVTNTELTNRKWFEIMSDGKDIGGYQIKGQLDAEFRLRNQIEGAFIFDRKITQNTLDGAGHRNMAGLVPEIRTGGVTGTYTPGMFSIPLFYQMIKNQKKLYAGTDFLCFLGVDLYQEWEQLFTDFFSENPVVFSAQGNTSVKDIEIDFKSIYIGTHKYHIKSMDIFSNPKRYNIPGYNLTGMGIVCPNKYEKDGKTKNLIPTIGMRYKAMDGYSRELVSWHTSGGNNYANNQPAEKLKLQMVTETGTEWMALNKFYLWEEQ